MNNKKPKQLRKILSQLIESSKNISRSKKDSFLQLAFSAQKPKLLELINTFTKLKPNEKITKKSFIEKRKPNVFVAKEQNKLVEKKTLDKIKFFAKNTYTYKNVKTLKDLYNNIKTQFKNMLYNQPATNAIVFFKSKTSNKIRAVTITANDLESFNDFNDFLNLVITGNLSGSDPIDMQEYDIILTNFSLTQVRVAGGSSSKHMIFKCIGIESTSGKTKTGHSYKKNDCAILCLEKCGIDIKNLDHTKFQDLYSLIKYIQDEELDISIISNSFTISRNLDDIFDDNGYIKKQIADKRGNMRNHICCQPILGTDININYLYKSETRTNTIIYDEVNKHFDLIQDNTIQLLDNIFIDKTLKTIKDNEIIFTARTTNINSMAKPEESVNKRFLFFDYETVINFDNSNCMQEYSLSILDLSNEELEQLNKYDEENNVNEINEIRNKCCHTFLGFDCSIQFIKWIIANQNNKAFVFIGFNNANFDNFIFLNALLKYCETNDDISVSNIFYNGSQLLNFYIAGRHNFFDIHKHLMGSLNNNCKSFKIKCCAKKSFDHNLAQQLYDNGKLIDYINNNNELKEYNEYDVLATAVLFCKYRQALAIIPATKKYSETLDEMKTIGSLIYKVFSDSKDIKKFNLPKLKLDTYKDLLKYKIAGRVEMFNGVQKVNERLASTDVCSLYPFVMSVLDVYYPCGDIKYVDTYQGDDEIGFYYCDIDQSNLKSANLPKIYARKTEIENDWGHDEVLNDYLISNVMISLLIKNNCKVIIKKGFIFTQKKKSCDMFDFLLDFMKEKNTQDNYKESKDPEESSKYNSALRETLKLLMNSLSGKVIEGLHTEKTTSVENVDEYNKIKEKANTINCVNSIGNKIFVTYELDEEKMIAKQRPVYLGVLIYDYAKRYMYEMSYSKIGLDQLLYTDTDASKFRYSKFIQWKQWVDDNNIIVPHWEEVEKIDSRYATHKIYDSNSKVFGSFEDELSKLIGTNYTFYCLEKKSWCYDVDGEAKFRFKGINENAQILTLTESFINKKIIKHKAKSGIKAWCETNYFINDSNENVHNYYVSNSCNNVGNNTLKFFDKVFTDGECYLLCNSFRKLVKNSKRNVEVVDTSKHNVLMNQIQVCYQLKHISLKK